MYERKRKLSFSASFFYERIVLEFRKINCIFKNPGFKNRIMERDD